MRVHQHVTLECLKGKACMLNINKFTLTFSVQSLLMQKNGYLYTVDIPLSGIYSMQNTHTAKERGYNHQQLFEI